MERSTKRKATCDRWREEYKENPSVNLNNRIMEWEGKYKMDWQEAGELTGEIIEMKYELLDRQIEEKYQDQ